MDEEDRYSASSNESERDNDNENENDNDNDNDNDNEADADEAMEDADEGDNDGENDDEEDDDAENDNEEQDGDNDNDNDDNENDNDAENEADRDPETQNTVETDGDGARAQSSSNEVKKEDGDAADGGADAEGLTERQREKQKEATPKPIGPKSRRPPIRPEAVTARLYDIVPTMAAPQATSVNAMAITPDLRYWFTGGSDGYIRKYDGPGTINGKLPLTVAQRHPFVDSVTKAGILMSYWENEEPSPPGRTEHDHVMSPVYSLAVHSDALWLLSGLESGGINLQSVRHDEGKRITCLQKHTNAVSVLTLAQDEKSVLSGSWDKNIFDWDLNTGQIKRSFGGSGGQIAAVELRPASGLPVPADADEPLPSTTMATNNGAPPTNGSLVNGDSFASNDIGAGGRSASRGNDNDEQGSPAHESLFGGSDAGSLFGETADGDQPFGRDEDEFNGSMSMMPGHEQEGGMDHSADMAMAGMEMDKDSSKDGAKEVEKEAPPVPTPAPAPSSSTAPDGDAMDIDSTSAQPKEEGQDQDQATAAGNNQSSSVNGSLDMSEDQLRIAQQLKREEDDQGQDSLADQPLRSPTFAGSPQNAENGTADPSLCSPHTFLSAAIDGPIRIWDRRVPNPVARISNRPGVPPWCMSACWSPDGNMIYAGRRNGTVEEFDVRKAKRGWEPERTLRFPAGSGAVSAVKPMANGRHLVW